MAGMKVWRAVPGDAHVDRAEAAKTDLDEDCCIETVGASAISCR